MREPRLRYVAVFTTLRLRTGRVARAATDADAAVRAGSVVNGGFRTDYLRSWITCRSVACLPPRPAAVDVCYCALLPSLVVPTFASTVG